MPGTTVEAVLDLMEEVGALKLIDDEVARHLARVAAVEAEIKDRLAAGETDRPRRGRLRPLALLLRRVNALRGKIDRLRRHRARLEAQAGGRASPTEAAAPESLDRAVAESLGPAPQEALFAACVAYGRDSAGLPPLEAKSHGPAGRPPPPRPDTASLQRPGEPPPKDFGPLFAGAPPAGEVAGE